MNELARFVERRAACHTVFEQSGLTPRQDVTEEFSQCVWGLGKGVAVVR